MAPTHTVIRAADVAVASERRVPESRTKAVERFRTRLKKNRKKYDDILLYTPSVMKSSLRDDNDVRYVSAADFD